MSDSTFNESNLNIDCMIEKFMTNDGERKSSNYQIEILERLNMEMIFLIKNVQFIMIIW
jgi:hypothetical protein